MAFPVNIIILKSFKKDPVFAALIICRKYFIKYASKF